MKPEPTIETVDMEINPEAVLLADIGDLEDIVKDIREEAEKIVGALGNGEERVKGFLKIADDLEAVTKDMETEFINTIKRYMKKIKQLGGNW